MGLIKAIAGAAGGALADSWRDFFTCDSISEDVLLTKGVKKSSSRSSNTKGNDNVISNGSIVSIADGQCMLITEQGKIVEVCAEPGEYVYDSSTEPTIFFGGLNKENIKQSLATVGKRFTFGGEAPKDQRVYYVNTKDIYGNKYGTATPIPFRVVDARLGLDLDVSIRCNGEYSYHICDPVKFYSKIAGNVSGDYTRDRIDSQLKSELMSALQPAFGRISEMGIRYSAITNHTQEIRDALKAELNSTWTIEKGFEIVQFGINSMTLPEEDLKQVQSAQRNANANLAASTITAAQAEAMVGAANNPGGAMAGFMGMGFAQNQGGANAAALYQMGAQQQAMQQPAAPVQPAAPAGGWKCACGATNTGKFCAECGQPKPADEGWTCSCGAVNKGKFCAECGKPKPAGAPLYRCDKCGWEPEDPHNPPKFCPECGDPFDANDIK